jgi:hypothetical protein
MNKERLFTPLLVILVVPVVLMMAMAWIVTDLEIVGKNEATREFMEARSVFGGLRPILSADQGPRRIICIFSTGVPTTQPWPIPGYPFGCGH